MTLFIVCHFRGGPVAAFSDPAKAHAYVQKQPGRFNSFEIEELELDAEAGK
jgi:hypothetical protein